MSSSPVRRDALLSRRIAAGEGLALGLVYEEHAEYLLRLAFGLTGNRADAEDIVQDVFLALPRTIAGFEGRCALGTWLHRVVARAATRRSGRASHRADLLREGLGLDEPAGSPIESQLDRIAVERALDRLPPNYRKVIWLRTAEGWGHSEIAESLGISENASAKLLHRARRMLRRILEGRAPS